MKLTRFRGHLILTEEGVRYAHTEAAVSGGVPSMQRLPAERMLDRVIAGGELQQRDVDALLQVLVPFYRHAPRPALGEDEYLRRLRDELAASRSVLALPRFDLPQIHGLLDRMDRAVATHEDMLRSRVRGRRIVEGHGDLRLAHMCLIEPPVVIDALEFDVRLREVDPFDELSFLSLECAMAGDAATGALRQCARRPSLRPPSSGFTPRTVRSCERASAWRTCSKPMSARRRNCCLRPGDTCSTPAKRSTGSMRWRRSAAAEGGSVAIA